MLDRLGGVVFAFYFLLVGSAAFAIVSAFSFALSISDRHVSVTTPRHPSRVEAQIRSKERSATHLPMKADLVVPSASNITASALAKGLDKAEGHLPPDEKSRFARRTRVAGWTRRQQRSQRSQIAKQSTSRIILRSLFAQNELP